ncbi:hypothetical protein BpHYR1_009597, partial [Brachionus plicatilis]
SKINLIRRIKGLRLKNSMSICKIIFKNFIGSQFDYAFIPLLCSTQKITSDIQKLQNKVLKHIKFFPLKTKIVTIHKFLNLDLLEPRSKKLLYKFLTKRANHQQLIQDLESYQAKLTGNNTNEKFNSLFQIFKSILDDV